MEPDPRDERGREWLDGVRPPCLPLGRMLAGSKMLRGPASGFASASAVGNAVSRHKPKCYGLTKEWLFEQESFHIDECPDDDICPCDRRPNSSTRAAKHVSKRSAHMAKISLRTVATGTHPMSAVRPRKACQQG